MRAPQNFNPLVRHPLLVVFPPAGHNSRRSEAFGNFTELATERGFIVLYPEHRRLNLRQMRRLGELVKRVAGEWCIDKTRIFFTGHSDGGTAAHVSAQQPDLGAPRPAKIAPSAAGVRAGDMTQLGCHHRLPVMIMHNRNDELFPDFGAGMRDWWLECNQCADTFDEGDDGCKTYHDCRQSNIVQFCELPGGHRQWNQDRSAILDFLLDI